MRIKKIKNNLKILKMWSKQKKKKTKLKKMIKEINNLISNVQFVKITGAFKEIF